MNTIKKLPDAEFEIMKVVWSNAPPITTNMIMEQLGKDKDWKAQTILTLMARLVERGFLRTEKHGKERTYYTLIQEEDYLRFETRAFMARFHGNSFTSLITTLYEGEKVKDKNLDDLEKWIKDRRE